MFLYPNRDALAQVRYLSWRGHASPQFPRSSKTKLAQRLKGLRAKEAVPESKNIEDALQVAVEAVEKEEEKELKEKLASDSKIKGPLAIDSKNLQGIWRRGSEPGPRHEKAYEEVVGESLGVSGNETSGMSTTPKRRAHTDQLQRRVSEVFSLDDFDEHLPPLEEREKKAEEESEEENFFEEESFDDEEGRAKGGVDGGVLSPVGNDIIESYHGRQLGGELIPKAIREAKSFEDRKGAEIKKRKVSIRREKKKRRRSKSNNKRKHKTNNNNEDNNNDFSKEKQKLEDEWVLTDGFRKGMKRIDQAEIVAIVNSYDEKEKERILLLAMDANKGESTTTKTPEEGEEEQEKQTTENKEEKEKGKEKQNIEEASNTEKEEKNQSQEETPLSPNSMQRAQRGSKLDNRVRINRKFQAVVKSPFLKGNFMSQGKGKKRKAVYLFLFKFLFFLSLGWHVYNPLDDYQRLALNQEPWR